MAMKDMNIAKLTSTDLPLFNGITQDLFPAVKTPEIDYSKVLHYPTEASANLPTSSSTAML